MYKVITQQTQIWTLEKDYTKVLLCFILEVAIGSLANASNRKCIHTDCTSPNSTVKQIFPINWESKFLPDHLLQAVGGRGQCLIMFPLLLSHPHYFSPGLLQQLFMTVFPLIRLTLLTDYCPSSIALLYFNIPKNAKSRLFMLFTVLSDFTPAHLLSPISCLTFCCPHAIQCSW